MGTTTANVLVTDLVRSTMLLAREGEEAAERQRVSQDRVVRNVVDVFGGKVLKSTGDGTMALLPSADLLVRAGSAVLEAAGEQGLPLRVGLATGDVVRTPSDCFGEAAVVASRLCDLATGGRVLVASSTAVVRGRRDDPPLIHHGRHVLKGFDEPVDVYAVDPVALPLRVAARDGIGVPALFGRDKVVAAVQAAWSRRSQSLIVIRGEPGIGKTHLARALVERAEGAAVLWVSFEPGVADGFARWCAAVDAAVTARPLGVIAALGVETVSRLAALLPSLVERVPVDPVPFGSEGDRELGFEALAAAISSLGREVVVVLDDVHWAGGTSLRLLGWLLNTGSQGVRVLATSRPPLPGELQGLGAQVIELGALDGESLEELLRSRGAIGGVVAAAVQRSGGNPFLALSAAAVNGGHDVVAVNGPQDPVAGRFLQLPRATIEVLGVAALLGRVIDVSLLQRVSGIGPAELLPALDDAFSAGLLKSGDHDRLAFAHDLVRETAAAGVPAHRRAALHAAVADALEERGDALGTVTHVLEGFTALEPLAAARRVDAACEGLLGQGAFEEILAVATRLVAIVEQDDRTGPRERAVAWLTLARAHAVMGHVVEHKRLAALAGWSAAEAGDHELLGRAALESAGTGLTGVTDRESLELLDEALRRVPTDDEAFRARLLGMRAFYLVNYEGRGSEARASVAKAVDAARRSGDADALADVLEDMSFVLMAGSEVYEQTVVLDELRALGPQLAYPGSANAEVMCHRQGGVLRIQLGDRAGFERHRAELIWWAQRWNSWLLRSLSTVWDGLAALLDGDPDGAEKHASTLLSADDTGHNFLASAAGQLAAAHRWRGTTASDTDLIVEFAASQPGLPVAASLATIALALSGDAVRASSTLNSLLSRTDPFINDTTLGGQVAAAVEACALTGQRIPPHSKTVLRDFTGQMLVLAWGVDVHGAADRFLGVIAALEGDTTTAGDYFARAEELEQRVSAAIPLRTQMWRHALVGDLPPPAVPPNLEGLHLEAATLKAIHDVHREGSPQSLPPRPRHR